jgi:hypothetical protein
MLPVPFESSRRARPAPVEVELVREADDMLAAVAERTPSCTSASRNAPS